MPHKHYVKLEQCFHRWTQVGVQNAMGDYIGRVLQCELCGMAFRDLPESVKHEAALTQSRDPVQVPSFFKDDWAGITKPRHKREKVKQHA